MWQEFYHWANHGAFLFHISQVGCFKRVSATSLITIMAHFNHLIILLINDRFLCIQPYNTGSSTKCPFPLPLSQNSLPIIHWPHTVSVQLSSYLDTIYSIHWLQHQKQKKYVLGMRNCFSAKGLWTCILVFAGHETQGRWATGSHWEAHKSVPEGSEIMTSQALWSPRIVFPPS